MEASKRRWHHQSERRTDEHTKRLGRRLHHNISKLQPEWGLCKYIKYIVLTDVFILYMCHVSALTVHRMHPLQLTALCSGHIHSSIRSKDNAIILARTPFISCRSADIYIDYLYQLANLTIVTNGPQANCHGQQHCHPRSLFCHSLP